MGGLRQAFGKTAALRRLAICYWKHSLSRHDLSVAFRCFAVSVALVTFAWAGIVEDIRGALDQMTLRQRMPNCNRIGDSAVSQQNMSKHTLGWPARL